jgi:hypothetical protein
VVARAEQATDMNANWSAFFITWNSLAGRIVRKVGTIGRTCAEE